MRSYTTKVHESKTISEIEQLLMQHGAIGIEKRIAQTGPETGKLVAFNFSIQWGTEGNTLRFRMPLNAEAARVKLTRDWLDTTMTLMELDQVRVAQVFLPYVINPTTGRTLYEELENRGFEALTVGGQVK